MSRAEPQQQRARRGYRMGRRAEQVGDTRQRIVEAAVTLHGTVGPAAASIVSIAERAGVTRATVYRHFPDDEALFTACSAHWRAGQQLPDPTAWVSLPDAADRLRAGLNDLYRFYRDGQTMLFCINRDLAVVPQAIRDDLTARDRSLRDLFASAFPEPKRSSALLGALAHAVSFWTWHSLCIEQQLDNSIAVELMCCLALGAAEVGRTSR